MCTHSGKATLPFPPLSKLGSPLKEKNLQNNFSPLKADPNGKHSILHRSKKEVTKVVSLRKSDRKTCPTPRKVPKNEPFLVATFIKQATCTKQTCIHFLKMVTTLKCTYIMQAPVLSKHISISFKCLPNIGWTVIECANNKLIQMRWLIIKIMPKSASGNAPNSLYGPVLAFPCLRDGPINKQMYRIYPAIRQGFCPSRMTSNN